MAGRISPEQAKALGLHDAPSGSISPEQAKALGLHDEAPTEQPSRLAEAALWWLSQPKVGLVPIPLGEGDPLVKLASFTNGVTQGLAPTIGAASDVLGAAASGAAPPNPGDTFMAKREGLRRFYTGAEAEEPALSLAGAMMTPLPGAKARGLGGAALRIGTAAGLGALNAEERAAPVSVLDSGVRGAELGAGLGVAAEAAGPVAGAAAKWLRGLSRENYLKAAGGVQSNIRKLKEPDAVADFIRDQGLAPFGGTPAGVKERVADFLDTGGKRLGAINDAMDAAGAQVLPGPMAARLRSLKQGLNPMSAGDLEPIIETAASRAEAGGPIPFSVAGDAKGYLQSQAKYAKANVDPSLQVRRDLARTYRDEMLRQGGEQVPGVRPHIEKALRDYELGSRVEELASRGAAATTGNRALGLSEQLGAVGAAAATGSPLAALKAAGAANLIRNRGASMAAPVLGAGADVVGSVSKVAQSIGTPAATSAAARKLWEWYGVAPKDEKDISKQYADQELPGL